MLQMVASVGDDVNRRTGVASPRVSRAKFPDDTSRRGKKSNVCETLICKLALHVHRV